MISIDDNYRKIGRLKQPIAKKIGVRCADIYVDEKHILHIAERHKKELLTLGIDAESYIRTIVESFNQVRQGSGNSLLLVIFNDNLSHVAGIDLNYSVKKGFWEVKTAQPRRSSEITKKKVLWQNCPSSE